MLAVDCGRFGMGLKIACECSLKAVAVSDFIAVRGDKFRFAQKVRTRVDCSKFVILSKSFAVDCDRGLI